MEDAIKKTDENDAMLLARIPREAFRLLTAKELELKMRMRPLINKIRTNCTMENDPEGVSKTRF
jgi:hypothetical protein